MNQVHTFGDFIDNLLEEYHEFLVLGFSPSSIPVQERWKNNGLSADFVSDYLANFLPLDDQEEEHQDLNRRIKESVNYIANELLENAMKFNNRHFNYPIKFGMHILEQDELVIILNVENSIDFKHFERLKHFIQDILSHDAQDFYLQQLERTVEGDDAPGIGLISMKNDYNAKLGWRLERVQEDPFVVLATTMVQLEYRRLWN